MVLSNSVFKARAAVPFLCASRTSLCRKPEALAFFTARIERAHSDRAGSTLPCSYSEEAAHVSPILACPTGPSEAARCASTKEERASPSVTTLFLTDKNDHAWCRVTSAAASCFPVPVHIRSKLAWGCGAVRRA